MHRVILLIACALALASCRSEVATQPPTPASVRGTTEVVAVIDGDTIRVRMEDATVETVRIIGIDTPETTDRKKPVQCFGREAAQKLRMLIEGQPVWLERKPSEDRDTYGRLLRYVHAGSEDIGATMVRDGFARSEDWFPHPRAEAYEALEASARAERRGRWGVCGAGDATPQVEAGRETAAPPTDCVIKGNISVTTQERIYHLPGCEYYDRTVIDSSKNERWFCSEEEATAAGWRKARNCP